MEVKIRALQAADMPFIFSSWSKHDCYGNKVLKKDLGKNSGKKRAWFREKCKQIAETVARAQVRVACLSEDPNVIIGYAVFLNHHFEFAYIKENYRSGELATLLVKGEQDGKPGQE